MTASSLGISLWHSRLAPQGWLPPWGQMTLSLQRGAPFIIPCPFLWFIVILAKSTCWGSVFPFSKEESALSSEKSKACSLKKKNPIIAKWLNKNNKRALRLFFRKSEFIVKILLWLRLKSFKRKNYNKYSLSRVSSFLKKQLSLLSSDPKKPQLNIEKKNLRPNLLLLRISDFQSWKSCNDLKVQNSSQFFSLWSDENRAFEFGQARVQILASPLARGAASGRLHNCSKTLQAHLCKMRLIPTLQSLEKDELIQ